MSDTTSPTAATETENHRAEYAPSERTRFRRRAGRGSYDRASVHALLDEALLCHVGVLVHGAPCVIPMAHVRVGEAIYLHGAPANRTLQALASGGQACIEATALDGLVLAKSAFHHSMNYRSVVAFGAGRAVTDPGEKRAAFDALVEKMQAGRSARVRPMKAAEESATLVVAFDLLEVSLKCRAGGPIDDEDDVAFPVEVGVVPVEACRGAFVETEVRTA